MAGMTQAPVFCLLYTPDAEDGREITLDEISDHVGRPGNFVWVELQEPGADLLKRLGEELGLHELALEDALTTHQRPKLEEYGEHIFISARTATLENERVLWGESHIFAGTNFIVAIAHGHLHPYVRVRNRLNASGVGRSAGQALYFALDEIVDQYSPVLTALQERFLGLEARLLAARLHRRDLDALYRLRREAALLRDHADPLQDVLQNLIRLHDRYVTKRLKNYYRDVLDHVLRTSAAADRLRQSAGDALQLHLALLTTRQNEAVQKLAGWGAILAVPTVVFSLYGMNFRWMPELGWKWGYPAVLAGTFLGALWLYRRFKRRGWI